jgi:anti-sigma factor RsiW
MNCNELVELVTDYLEGTLPAGDRQRFDEHLADCDGCVNYLGQMRETITLTGTLTTDDVSPAAAQTLLAAFRAFTADG